MSMEEGRTGVEGKYDLTGFTSRLVRLLAWWRETWISADPTNQEALQCSLVYLILGSPSMLRHTQMVYEILEYDHERIDEMMEGINRCLVTIVQTQSSHGERYEQHRKTAKQWLEAVLAIQEAQ